MVIADFQSRLFSSDREAFPCELTTFLSIRTVLYVHYLHTHKKVKKKQYSQSLGRAQYPLVSTQSLLFFIGKILYPLGAGIWIFFFFSHKKQSKMINRFSFGTISKAITIKATVKL